MSFRGQDSERKKKKRNTETQRKQMENEEKTVQMELAQFDGDRQAGALLTQQTNQLLTAV